MRWMWIAALALTANGCSLLVESRLKKSDAGTDASTDGDVASDAPEHGEEGGAPDGSIEAASSDPDGGDASREDDASLEGDASPEATGDGAAQPGASTDTPEDGSTQAPMERPDAGPAAKTARERLVGCTGEEHGCLLDDEGKLLCFGSNERDQAPRPQGTYKALACGAYHTCALVADTGALRCWGDNGALQRVQDEGPFEEVVAGNAHTCALDAQGRVQCWGDSSLADSDVGQTQFLHIAAGDDFSCGIRADDLGGKCWGNDGSFRLKIPAGVQFTELALADNCGCGLSKDGQVRCWGNVSQPDPAKLEPGALVLNEWVLCTLNDNIARCAERPGSSTEFTTMIEAQRWATLFGGHKNLCAIPEKGKLVCSNAELSLSELELPPSE